MLLAGGEKAAEKKTYNYSEIEYPDDCIVDFDMHLIDLFKELDKKCIPGLVGSLYLSLKRPICRKFIKCRFYNNGEIRLAVTEKEVLESWIEFFRYGNQLERFLAWNLL